MDNYSMFDDLEQLWKRTQEVARRHPHHVNGYLGQVDGLSIYLVDGHQVKRLCYMDFVEGGHDLVYPDFIPPGEVWIDGRIHVHDRPAILLHELVERRCMECGLSYEEAHEIANEIEMEARYA
jgi:hypothetical protein